MPDIRPYENGSSEPNSVHVLVYPCPSDSSKLLATVSWDRIEGTEWKKAWLANKAEVGSVQVAIDKAAEWAAERGIPVVFVENHADK